MHKFDKIHDLFCRPTVVVPISGLLLAIFIFAEIGRHNYYTKELIEILEERGQFPDKLRQDIHNFDIHKTKRFLNYARKHKQIQAIELMRVFYKKSDPNSTKKSK